MSTQDLTSGYAYWIPPGRSIRILYSLTLFHEIEFLVNEGYRQIPHGGIEVGGLLLGTRDTLELRLEAFRPIQCEHEAGPSFKLSQRDLRQLNEQITATKSDPELQSLRLMGWFVAHTRSPLHMSDLEAGWFDGFFPEPDSIAVLVKPEHFQPTRFGFLIREADGSMERDATDRAVILPLGRASNSAGQPVESVPAPVPQAALLASRIIRPEEKVARPVSPPPVKPIEQTALPALTPGPLEQIEPVMPHTIRSSRKEVTSPRLAQEVSSPSLASARRDAAPQSNLRFAAILLISAILGCVAGYWCYLQLPSPVIPLSLRADVDTLLVSWPASQTADLKYVTIRINDGEPRALSSEEKNNGRLTLSEMTGTIKIELVAQHWLRDSRGMLRYLRETPPPLTGTPVDSSSPDDARTPTTPNSTAHQ